MKNDYVDNGLNCDQISKLFKYINLDLSGFDVAELLSSKNIRPSIKNNMYPIQVVRNLIYEQIGDFGHKGKVISVMNNKGGVGKTLTTYIQATTLHSMGANVLVIDTDGQKNLTGITSGNFDEEEPNIYNCLEDSMPLMDMLFEVSEGFRYVRGTRKIDLYKRVCYQDGLTSLNRMMEEVEQLKEYFDFILIDTSPTLDDFNVGLVAFSDLILAPVELDTQAFHGVKELFNEIKTVCDQFGQDPFKKLRIILNATQKGRIQKEILDTVVMTYEQMMFSEDLLIPNANRLKEATNYGAPLWALKDFKHPAVESSYRLSRFIVDYSRQLSTENSMPALPVGINENEELGGSYDQ